MAVDLKRLIQAASERALSALEAEQAFDVMMSGDATPAQIGGILMAMRTRGETVDEFAAAATVMRAKCVSVNAPEGTMDLVGTGGDGKGTLNISTAAALVVAGSGVTVAKHGNRSISSKSGAADLLTNLGISVMVGADVVERAISEAGIGFMMAPVHHPAMRHVMPTRQDLGTRTIFNILGPLTNPAHVRRQLTGAYSPDLLLPMAETLQRLGTERAWLVHGSDGTDEISICGSTKVVALENDKITQFTVEPQDAGLEARPFSGLRGGSPSENAESLERMLEGQKSTYREAVVLNAAAALLIAGAVQNLREGVELAIFSIDSGKARNALNALVRVTSNSSNE